MGIFEGGWWVHAFFILQWNYKSTYLKRVNFLDARQILPCAIQVKFFQLAYWRQSKWDQLNGKDFSIFLCLQSASACKFNLKMKIQNFLLHGMNDPPEVPSISVTHTVSQRNKNTQKNFNLLMQWQVLF